MSEVISVILAEDESVMICTALGVLLAELQKDAVMLRISDTGDIQERIGKCSALIDKILAVYKAGADG